MHDPQLHADVPFSMHPSCVAPETSPVLAVEGTLGPRVLDAAGDALNEAYRLYSAIEDTEAALRGAAPKQYITNGKQSRLIDLPHGKEHQYQDLLDKAYERCTKTIGQKIDSINGCIEILDNQINEAAKDPQGSHIPNVIVQGEIRAYVSKLDDVKKLDFIRSSIVKGDKRSVWAVINAPGYLSGISESEVKDYTDMARQAWAPDATAQMKEAIRMRANIDLAYRYLKERYKKSKGTETTADMVASKALEDMRGMLTGGA